MSSSNTAEFFFFFVRSGKPNLAVSEVLIENFSVI